MDKKKWVRVVSVNDYVDEYHAVIRKDAPVDELARLKSELASSQQQESHWRLAGQKAEGDVFWANTTIARLSVKLEAITLEQEMNAQNRLGLTSDVKELRERADFATNALQQILAEAQALKFVSIAAIASRALELKVKI